MMTRSHRNVVYFFRLFLFSNHHHHHHHHNTNTYVSDWICVSFWRFIFLHCFSRSEAQSTRYNRIRYASSFSLFALPSPFAPLYCELLASCIWASQNSAFNMAAPPNSDTFCEYAISPIKHNFLVTLTGIRSSSAIKYA